MNIFEEYPYMIQGERTFRAEAIGGSSVDVIHPSLLFKRKVSALVSGISQPPYGEPSLMVGRVKDIVDAYSLSRAMAATYYKGASVDFGGIITGMKTSRGALLEEFSNTLRDYMQNLPGAQRAEALQMFLGIQTDLLRGVSREPVPAIDILTGRGIFEGTEWAETATLMLFRKGLSESEEPFVVSREPSVTGSERQSRIDYLSERGYRLSEQYPKYSGDFYPSFIDLISPRAVISQWGNYAVSELNKADYYTIGSTTVPYPPYSPPTWPNDRRRRKKKYSRKTAEWYIWNPVPLFETVFGYNVPSPWMNQKQTTATKTVKYPRPMGKFMKLPAFFSEKPRF
jgi:hypothetical protein